MTENKGSLTVLSFVKEERTKKDNSGTYNVLVIQTEEFGTVSMYFEESIEVGTHSDLWIYDETFGKTVTRKASYKQPTVSKNVSILLVPSESKKKTQKSTEKQYENHRSEQTVSVSAALLTINKKCDMLAEGIDSILAWISEMRLKESSKTNPGPSESDLDKILGGK